MSTVSFNFRPGLSRVEEDEILERLGAVTGIARVGRIAPGVEDPLVERMCYAEVDPERLEEIRRVLADMAEIEFAAPASERFAI